MYRSSSQFCTQFDLIRFDFKKIFSRQMSVGAEYTMKQSKLHMSIDSGLLIKRSLSTTVAPGTEMQFCAEMQQAAQHYRFGLGVMMG